MVETCLQTKLELVVDTLEVRQWDHALANAGTQFSIPIGHHDQLLVVFVLQTWNGVQHVRQLFRDVVSGFSAGPPLESKGEVSQLERCCDKVDADVDEHVSTSCFPEVACEGDGVDVGQVFGQTGVNSDSDVIITKWQLCSRKRGRMFEVDSRLEGLQQLLEVWAANDLEWVAPADQKRGQVHVDPLLNLASWFEGCVAIQRCLNESRVGPLAMVFGFVFLVGRLR